jgi:hypothetical protein
MGNEAARERSRLHMRVKSDVARKDHTAWRKRQGCLSTFLSFLATESNDLSKIIDSREVGDFHRAVIGEIDERLPIQDSEPL